MEENVVKNTCVGLKFDFNVRKGENSLFQKPTGGKSFNSKSYNLYIFQFKIWQKMKILFKIWQDDQIFTETDFKKMN